MNRTRMMATFLFLAVLACSPGILAQDKPTADPAPANLVDSLGVIDTMYADLVKLGDDSWSITFSYAADEEVVGFSIPFTYKAELNRLVADSAKFSEHVANWDFKSFRVDTTIQTVTIGMIANISTNPKELGAGTWPLVTVYVSSLENKPIEKLAIDTTTTHPGNMLMCVADMMQGKAPNEKRLTPLAVKIYPAWVVRQPKKE